MSVFERLMVALDEAVLGLALTEKVEELFLQLPLSTGSQMQVINFS
jgi:hypothetical protein